MAGKNEREMVRVGRLVGAGCVRAGIETMALIHRGTISRFGSSPGTPVDRGEAKAGGQVAIGAQPTFAPRPDASSYREMSEGAARQELASAQLGDDLHWANNVPHVVFLDPKAGVVDEGKSKQAPEGWLQQSVDAATPIVEGTEFVS